MKHEFARFLVVGTVAAMANLLSAWCYRQLLETTLFCFEASVAVGFSVGTVISFVLNKFFTFRANDGKTWIQAVRFGLMSIVSVVLSAAVAHLLFQVLHFLVVATGTPGDRGLVEAAAHVLTIGVMMVLNYLMMKHFAFRRRSRS